MGNIRSEYIKNLMAEKNALSDTLAEATKESLRSILSESVNKGIRQILSEAENDEKEFDVETISDEETAGTEDVKATDTEEPKEEETETEISVENEPEAETEDETGTEDETEDEGDEEVWSKLDSYIDADGEYDLTGMSDEEMLTVKKVIDPVKDGIRVVKNDDNTITLTDDNAGTEYIIDLEDAEDEENALGESKINEEGILGYTDEYQKETAMTLPSDDGKGGQLDGGAPKGNANNGRRWVGNAGDMAPYNEETETDDEMVFEVEMDECGMSEGDEIEEQSRFGMANYKGMHKTPTSKNDHTVYGAHVISREGRYTGLEPDGTANESVNRRLNAITAENKQLKKIAGQIESKLNEAVVMNASLAKIIKLVTENSTTKDEKMEIVKRFNNVKTLNECKDVYEAIDAELKKTHPINNNVDSLIATQVNESKPMTKKDMIVETTLLNSKELSDTIDLMRRVEKC